MIIGIVTQPLNGNFGGIIQNFALQKILFKMGHTPITLDYQWNHRWYKYPFVVCKSVLQSIIQKKKYDIPLFCPTRKNNAKHIFIQSYINKTDKYVYRYEQKLLNELNIEAVIVGSDQVWRPKYNPDLKDMFLKFVKDNNILKIAYAASFGTEKAEYSKLNISLYKRLIHKFNAISVRERSGSLLLKQYFDINAQNVLDPTMLVSPEDYIQHFDLGRRLNSDFKSVVTYILDSSSDKARIIQRLKELNSNHNLIHLSTEDDDLSPKDWLRAIYNADLVITDSFHGTVFSILFHKQFISITNKERGKDRFISLLFPLGLMGRMVEDSNCDLEDVMNKKIDWPIIDEKIRLNRIKSINFLKAALKPHVTK